MTKVIYKMLILYFVWKSTIQIVSTLKDYECKVQFYGHSFFSQETTTIKLYETYFYTSQGHRHHLQNRGYIDSSNYTCSKSVELMPFITVDI